MLLSWRRIVNISVKKIEQWWGLPAVKKSNEAEEERKCCSFWFVPADFVVELAGAIGEAAGAEEEKSSSGSNSGGNRRSKFLAQYLDASTPTTTLSRCFARACSKSERRRARSQRGRCTRQEMARRQSFTSQATFT